jgi:uncharacterized protein (DUF1015 family)
MAVATLSPEGQMIERLRKLNCAEVNFAHIATGIVGKTRLAQAFKDSTKAFDRATADKLNQRLCHMEELQAAISPIPIAWERIEEVRSALAIRLANQIEIEKGNTELQSAAEWATRRVTA